MHPQKARAYLKGTTVDIKRHLIMDSGNFRPIISRAVVHEGKVYLCGITADPI
jgi:hypothetical protein